MTKEEQLKEDYKKQLKKLIKYFTKLGVIDILDEYYIYKAIDGKYNLNRKRVNYD